IRAGGAKELTNSSRSSPRRSPSWPKCSIPVRPAASMPRASAVTASSRRCSPKLPEARAGQSTIRRPIRSSGPFTHVTTATGSCRSTDSLISPSSGDDSRDTGPTKTPTKPPPARPQPPLDEDVQDAAAGQADGEGVVVADAVPLQGHLAGLDGVLRLLVDRALDAAAGDAADRCPVRTDQHRGAGRAGRGAPRRHDGAHADGLPRLPPTDQVVEHVTHPRTPSGVESPG